MIRSHGTRLLLLTLLTGAAGTAWNLYAASSADAPDLDPRYELARGTLRDAADPRAARAAALSALELRPDDVAALDALARVDPLEAEVRLRKLVAANPRDEHRVGALADMIAAQGGTAEAEHLLLRYLATDAPARRRSSAVGRLIPIAPEAAFRWMTNAPDAPPARWRYLADELVRAGRADLAAEVCRRRIAAGEADGLRELLRELEGAGTAPPKG